FNKFPEGVEIGHLSPESPTETRITATYVTDSEEVSNSRKDTKDGCVTSSNTSQTKSDESSFKTSHWDELDCQREENVPYAVNDRNKCTTKRPEVGADEKLTDDPAEHCEYDPKLLLKTSMKRDCYDKVIEAQNLQAELARIKQTNEELTARVKRLFHDRQALEFQLEAQELKNNQLTKENAECLVHVTENRFLEETIQRLKEQLNEIAEQTDISRLARRQLRAECVRMELERQRLVDEYLRLETSRASNREELEALNRRRQQLELFQEDIVQRQQLANRWQEVAGTIRIFVRIRSQTSKTESSEKSTRFPYESGCLVVPAEDKIGIYLNRGQNASICGAAGTTTTDNTVRLYNFNQIFPPGTPQCKVYQSISNQVKRILDGYNVTVLHSDAPIVTCILTSAHRTRAECMIIIPMGLVDAPFQFAHPAQGSGQQKTPYEHLLWKDCTRLLYQLCIQQLVCAREKVEAAVYISYTDLESIKVSVACPVSSTLDRTESDDWLSKGFTTASLVCLHRKWSDEAVCNAPYHIVIGCLCDITG
ncbi:hypothetical protein X801_03460, partial [Opisthorchis viverrini]